MVFKAENVEVPAFWSQVASDVLAQKYFRKAGVPARAEKGRGRDRPVVPVALGRRRGCARGTAREGAHRRRDVRPSRCSTGSPAPGPTGAGRAATSTRDADAQAFFDELRYMLAMQMVAPNSPQWFNTGLHWAYGIDGPSQGHYYVDFQTGKLTKSKIVVRASAAARLLHPVDHRRPRQRRRHHGPVGARGAPVQVRLRHRHQLLRRCAPKSERLSGGGKSSGLMSFLKIGDRAAGAIKSGGTTRRAAKMVIVDTDHPDIEQFIDWKVKEEQKVAALVTGSKINQKHLKAVLKACVNCEGSGDDCFQPEKNPALKREIKLARRNHVPDNFIKRVIQFAKQGYTDIDFPIYDTDWD